MSEKKVILHIDANNFYASVEACLDPDLKGKAIAVSGDPEKRHGIILAKSELAKKCGVTTGEVIWQAQRKCPNLILVPPHHNEYVKFSKRLFDVYTQYTDRVEPFSIDECWLDVTHSLKLFKSGEAIAEEIRRRAKEEIGVSVSIGVSFTKIFSKLGSDMKKPDATTVINEDNYKTLVWKLPVRDMMGIGGSTEETLKKLNVTTIGGLAHTNRDLLKSHIGILADKLIDAALGIEDEEIRYYYDNRIPESIGHSTTLPLDISTLGEVEAIFTALAEMVATRMRRHSLVGNSVSIWIKYNNMKSITRQSTLLIPTSTSSDIVNEAIKIFSANHDFSKDLPIRALGVAMSKVTNENESVYQMSIFDEKDVKSEKLEKTVDTLRAKYGYDIMKKASSMKYDNICRDLKDSDFVPFKK